MRRRVIREQKKQEVKPEVKEKVKEVVKKVVDVIKKDDSEFIKEAKLKSVNKEDISTNKVPTYDFISKTTEECVTVPIKDYLDWIFSNVLTFDDLIVEGQKYPVMVKDQHNFQIVNNYDLKGKLVAGSCICYDCESFGLGIIIDKVLDKKQNVLSSINISYNGSIVPGEDISNELVSWIITNRNLVIPVIKDVTVKDMEQFLDGSLENYGAHYPINYGIQTFNSTKLCSIKPNRKLENNLPTQDSIPTVKMTDDGTNYNIGVSVTGYFFMYNKTTNGSLDDSCHLVMNYIRVPIQITGTPDLIQIAKCVDWDISNEEFRIAIHGECINVIQLPAKCQFYQENFGDANTNVYSRGKGYVCYPLVYNRIYHIAEVGDQTVQ